MNRCLRVLRQFVRGSLSMSTSASSASAGKKLPSFYSLGATDIEGKKLDFKQFSGRVSYVTNVASR